MAFQSSFLGLNELPERPLARREITALTDTSEALRDIQRRLTLVQRQATPLPQVNALPPRIDDRMGGAATKTRKSVLSPHAQNRIASEFYPVASPPYHDFTPGKTSRYIGRDPAVQYK